MQGGDALQDMYNVTVDIRFLLGNIFFYVYVFLIISLVQNVFMTIVEDAYLQVKYAKNTDWLLLD
jgi:hypothetical protein